jgi:hypothetical protein
VQRIRRDKFIAICHDPPRENGERTMRERIIRAALVAGTLDIFSAFVFAGMAGTAPHAVLQFVASGPLGDRARGDPAWIGQSSAWPSISRSWPAWRAPIC